MIKSLNELRKIYPKAYNFICKTKKLEYIRDKYGWRCRNWTKGRCIEEAGRYKTRSEWWNCSGSSYNAARKNCWLDECCRHMPDKKTNWTKEKCIEEAKKYNKSIDWQKNSGSSYNAAKKNDWYNECVSIAKLLTSNNNPKNYWTREKCIEEAKKYKYKGEWQKSHSTSYTKALKNDWIDECSQHMVIRNLPSGYWTKEKCVEQSKNFKSRNSWSVNSQPSYKAALKNGWLDECCSHMPIIKLPTNYWTKDKCIEEARKYTSRIKWAENDKKSYRKACDNDWLDECCQHMIIFKLPNGYWTKEKCIEEARKYTSRIKWANGHNSSYSVALRDGWSDECCSHMSKQFRWTKELCLNESKKYNAKNEWAKNNSPSYTVAWKNKWLDECSKHMTSGRTSWPKKKCIKEARKYKTRSEWRINSGGSYNAAWKNKWLDVCTKHMK